MYTIMWAGLEPKEAGWSPPSDTNPKYMGSLLAPIGRCVRVCGWLRSGMSVTWSSVEFVCLAIHPPVFGTVCEAGRGLTC